MSLPSASPTCSPTCAASKSGTSWRRPTSASLSALTWWRWQARTARSSSACSFTSSTGSAAQMRSVRGPSSSTTRCLSCTTTTSGIGSWELQSLRSLRQRLLGRARFVWKGQMTSSRLTIALPWVISSLPRHHLLPHQLPPWPPAQVALGDTHTLGVMTGAPLPAPALQSLRVSLLPSRRILSNRLSQPASALRLPVRPSSWEPTSKKKSNGHLLFFM